MIAHANFTGAESGPYIPASGRGRYLRAAQSVGLLICGVIWATVYCIACCFAALWRFALVPLFQTVVLGKSADEQMREGK